LDYGCWVASRRRRGSREERWAVREGIVAVVVVVVVVVVVAVEWEVLWVGGYRER
jgi:t-SNARE complex subunit (syntaxin)